jgi:hydrogenase nickel incorporation protein HypA/HybF
MHEMGVTQSILSIVLDQAKQNGAKRVIQVNLEIGEMTNIVSDCVEFYFDIISKETIASGAKLVIESVPLQSKCAACGNVFEVRDYTFVCPKCSNISPDIISGKELAVTSIEIE